MPEVPDEPLVPLLPLVPEEPDVPLVPACPVAPAVFINQDVNGPPLPTTELTLTTNCPVPLVYVVTVAVK